MITVVTPTLNAADALQKTLESMRQQQGDFEHLVLDGGSNDATYELCSHYRNLYPLRYVQTNDLGVYDAVERGFSLAKGDVLSWLNAGDFYMPWTVAVVRAVFERHLKIDWITGIPSWNFAATGVAVCSAFAPVYPRSLIRHGWYSGARLGFLQQESMFWRRSLWDRSNGSVLFKGKGRKSGYAQDYWLWRRFAEFTSLHTVSCVLSSFSVTSGQISERNARAYLEECMLPGRSAHSNPAWGRAVQRVLSVLLFSKVIKPIIVER